MKRRIGRILLITLLIGLILNLTACQAQPLDNSLNGKREAIIRENLQEWFGGKELEKYRGSNRDYDWYIDQGNTGEYSHSNCGPSSAVMAMKWLDKDFPGSVEEARNEHLLSGGWWFTQIISKYFDDREVDYSYLMFKRDNMEESIEGLKMVIDESKVALLCIDMDYISRENDNSLHVNRFYDYDDGHFLIVKGYAEIDNETYFEVYDPNNWGRVYEDGSPMGLDRFYEGEELINSAVNWYEFAIVIEESSGQIE